MNKLITISSLISIGILNSCATISKLRQGSNNNDQSLAPAPKISEEQKRRNAERLRAMEPVSQIQPIPSETKSTKPTQKNRTIQGMIEPDVTNIPEDKILQESNNVLPIESPSIIPPSNTTRPLPNSISPLIPEITKPEAIKPKDTTPLKPTIPSLPSLPGALEPLPTLDKPQ